MSTNNQDKPRGAVPPKRVPDSEGAQLGYQYDEPGQQGRVQEHFVPLGADEPEDPCFEDDVPYGIDIPPRMCKLPGPTVQEVNDWHFAMMNDVDRNEAYRLALADAIKPTDVVLDIGAGSGLLSMMAAQAGAKQVYSVEASKAFADISTKIVSRNNMTDKITLVKDMSTNVRVKGTENKNGRNTGKVLDERPTVLVAELLGTLLNSESTIRYYQDARERLLTKNPTILPACGTQYAVLVSSDLFASITQAGSYNGLNLDYFNTFRDSVTLLFTKHYGVTLDALKCTEVTEPIEVYNVDFYKDGPDVQPSREGRRYITDVIADGKAQAVVFYWTVWMGKDKTGPSITTEPTATAGNLPRNMNWGQAIQLVEDPAGWDAERPTILDVKKGQRIELLVQSDGVSLNARVTKVLAPEEKVDGPTTQTSEQPCVVLTKATESSTQDIA